MNLIGLVTLVKDSELKYTQTGTAVLSFSGAYNIGYGESKETMWLRCAIFGKKAESLKPHLTKGTKIEITAKDLKLTTYQKQDGTFGASLECIVNDIEFAGSKNDNQQPQTPQQQPQPMQQQTAAFAQMGNPQQPMQQASSFDDDDVLF